MTYWSLLSPSLFTHAFVVDGSDSSDEEDLDEDPILETRFIKHNGGINRVRVSPHNAGMGYSFRFNCLIIM